jgi:ribonuclease-3
MESLETRIDHHFRTNALLAEALTHPSLSYENRRRDPDNQRLEFLGDSILSLVISEELYKRLPDSDEGTLTRMRSRLVSAPTLAMLARQLDLGAHLKLGRAEENNGGRERESALADALEALIGAVYLDSTLLEAQRFILKIYAEELHVVMVERPEIHNPKGQLQEILQGASGTAPVYEIVNSAGPDHQRHYEAAALWDGRKLGRGYGASKKEAEIEAARQALNGQALEALLQELSAQRLAGTTKNV